MAELHTIRAGQAAPPREHRPPSAPNVDQAAGLFMEIAGIAARTDRECFHLHGDIIAGDETDASRVCDELTRLREVILHLGWLADLGSLRLTGSEAIRGDAEEWLLPPVLQRSAEGSNHG